MDALLLILVLGLAACSGQTAQHAASSPPPSPNDQPRQGGTLTVSFLSGPSSLDPALPGNTTALQITHDIYQGLLRYAHAPGLAGTELIPCLADAVPSLENGGISPDRLVYTFRLREGARFQPPVSREVTAADFKYSFERMMRAAPPPSVSALRSVAGAEDYIRDASPEIDGYKVVDARTVEISLERPEPSFLHTIAMTCCDVVPEEWVEKWGDEFNRNPLGTGPFVLQKWTREREIVLTRNPDYWEAGMPHLDGVNYQLSVAPSAALSRLERGEVDVLGDGLPGGALERVTADPGLHGLVFSQPVVAAGYLSMDVATKPFDDVRVRRALSWAIDRESLARPAAGGVSSLWQFYPEGLPGHEQGKVYYGYDTARAKRLLKKAGYPNGFRTTLHADGPGPGVGFWRAVRADLAAVGVRARLEVGDGRTPRAQRPGSRPPAMGSLTWRMDIPDPSGWVVTLCTRPGTARDDTSPGRWWDPEVEKMYAQAQALSDPAARLSAFSRMQDRIAGQAPYIPLCQPVHTTMCSRSTGGFYLHPVYGIDTVRYWKK